MSLNKSATKIKLGVKDGSLKGLIVASYGKRYDVELANLSIISCVTRGKKTDLACGDFVQIQLTDKKEGVIESSLPRSSLLYRSNTFKSKILAANVTQIVITLATQPSFYESLLNRCLVAAEAANIKPLIILNKCDLADITDAKNTLKIYENLGYRVLHLTATENVTGLMPHLENHQSVLVGQSGMGKSTIINSLLPTQNVRTQTVSTALDSGKHTTTAAHLYHLNENSHLIDSPGLQEFGLNHLSNEQFELAFIEFRPYLGKCRFNNCKHDHEPDCAVINAVNTGNIHAKRLAFYQELSKELMLSQ